MQLRGELLSLTVLSTAICNCGNSKGHGNTISEAVCNNNSKWERAMAHKQAASSNSCGQNRSVQETVEERKKRKKMMEGNANKSNSYKA